MTSPTSTPKSASANPWSINGEDDDDDESITSNAPSNAEAGNVGSSARRANMNTISNLDQQQQQQQPSERQQKQQLEQQQFEKGPIRAGNAAEDFQFDLTENLDYDQQTEYLIPKRFESNANGPHARPQQRGRTMSIGLDTQLPVPQRSYGEINWAAIDQFAREKIQQSEKQQQLTQYLASQIESSMSSSIKSPSLQPQLAADHVAAIGTDSVAVNHIAASDSKVSTGENSSMNSNKNISSTATTHASTNPSIPAGDVAANQFAARLQHLDRRESALSGSFRTTTPPDVSMEAGLLSQEAGASDTTSNSSSGGHLHSFPKRSSPSAGTGILQAVRLFATHARDDHETHATETDRSMDHADQKSSAAAGSVKSRPSLFGNGNNMNASLDVSNQNHKKGNNKNNTNANLQDMDAAEDLDDRNVTEYGAIHLRERDASTNIPTLPTSLPIQRHESLQQQNLNPNQQQKNVSFKKAQSFTSPGAAKAAAAAAAAINAESESQLYDHRASFEKIAYALTSNHADAVHFSSSPSSLARNSSLLADIMSFRRHENQHQSTKKSTASYASSNPKPLERVSFYSPATGVIRTKDLFSLVFGSSQDGIAGGKELFTQPLIWIDICQQSSEDLHFIEKVFGIHPLTSEDILTDETREKCEVYNSYLYICFRAMHKSLDGDGEENDLLSNEDSVNLSIVMYKSIVLSFHAKPVIGLSNVFKRLMRMSDDASITSDWVLYSILDEITDSIIPLVSSLMLEVDSIDELVLMLTISEQTDLIRRIGNARRQLTVLTRFLQAKGDVLRALLTRITGKVSDTTVIYVRDVQDHVITMMIKLKAYDETLNRSHANYLGQVNIDLAIASTRTNEVMKRFSAVATIILPLSLISSIMGMNTWVPYEQDPIGFWSVMVLMGIITVALLYLGRRYQWF